MLQFIMKMDCSISTNRKWNKQARAELCQAQFQLKLKLVLGLEKNSEKKFVFKIPWNGEKIEASKQVSK